MVCDLAVYAGDYGAGFLHDFGDDFYVSADPVGGQGAGKSEDQKGLEKGGISGVDGVFAADESGGCLFVEFFELCVGGGCAALHRVFTFRDCVVICHFVWEGEIFVSHAGAGPGGDDIPF